MTSHLKNTFKTITNKIDQIYTNSEDNQTSDNFFSISTKAYYENPFSKILSYILSKQYKSEFKRIILQELLKDICTTEEIESLYNKCETITEHQTSNGKRIDLIIFNDNIVIAFENKINHTLNNPLKEYEDEINELYSHIERREFIILSYKKEDVKGIWKFIGIKETFAEISKNIDIKKSNQSWDYYANDFINHFKEEKKEIIMNKEELSFIEENYVAILKASKILESNIKKIKESIELENKIFKTTIHDKDKWGKNEIAIRFYPNQDDNDNNVTLVFGNNQSLYISTYYYIPIEEQENRKTLTTKYYANFSIEENKPNFICFKSKHVLANIDEALTLLKDQIKAMRDNSNLIIS